MSPWLYCDDDDEIEVDFIYSLHPETQCKHERRQETRVLAQIYIFSVNILRFKTILMTFNAPIHLTDISGRC